MTFNDNISNIDIMSRKKLFRLKIKGKQPFKENIYNMVKSINLNRETWVVYNNSTTKIFIGDIPNAPVIEPSQSIDLLLYGSKEVISQSRNLVSLIQNEILTFVKQVSNDFDNIPANEGGEAVTSAEENELVNQVLANEEITSDTKGVIAYGKDQNDTAQPIEFSGAEGDELQIMSLDMDQILIDILDELVKLNIQMSIITGNEIRNKDI